MAAAAATTTTIATMATTHMKNFIRMRLKKSRVVLFEFVPCMTLFQCLLYEKWLNSLPLLLLILKGRQTSKFKKNITPFSLSLLYFHHNHVRMQTFSSSSSARIFAAASSQNKKCNCVFSLVHLSSFSSMHSFVYGVKHAHCNSLFAKENFAYAHLKRN